MRALAAVGFALALSCATAGPRRAAEGLAAQEAREVLSGFARALEEGRFADAHALLALRWRSGYTPGRLALDFGGAGPMAGEAARRVLAAISAGGSPVPDAEGRARLPLGGGRAAVLVAEEGAWRVDALE